MHRQQETFLSSESSSGLKRHLKGSGKNSAREDESQNVGYRILKSSAYKMVQTGTFDTLCLRILVSESQTSFGNFSLIPPLAAYAVSAPSMSCVSLVAARCAERPDAVGLRFLSPQLRVQELTFRQVWGLAAELAERLREQPAGVVAVAVDDGPYDVCL